MHDVLIIGAGPAGRAAAVTASALGLSVLLVAKDSPDLGSYPRFGLVSCASLVAPDQSGKVTAEFGREVVGLEKNVVSFSAHDLTGGVHYARAVILATGTPEGPSFEQLSAKDGSGRVKVDSRMATKTPGLFAAGDLIYRTLALDVAAAHGTNAALGAYRYLSGLRTQGKVNVDE